MPYMYILECADGSYYTGSTKELERRLWEHQNGLGANHTSKRLPVKLVYCEECDRIDDAFYREKQVQGWSRKKKEALMASDYNQIHLLAVCKNETHCSGSAASASLSTSPLDDRVGFDSAQPTGTGIGCVHSTVQQTGDLARSLSCRVSGVEPGVEGNNAETGDMGCKE
jgi:putative endonuclease